jgi:hypothetical protein
MHIEKPGFDNASWLWVALLAAASLGTNVVLGCATPFAALAALAATQLPRRAGIALMLLCWAGSQAVGFGLHGFHPTAETLGWAAAMAVGAVAALLVAASPVGMPEHRPRNLFRHPGVVPGAGSTRTVLMGIARLARAYLAAFVVFKVTILLAATVIASDHAAMLVAPGLLWKQFSRDGLFLIGLALFHRALLATGVPAPAEPAAA